MNAIIHVGCYYTDYSISATVTLFPEFRAMHPRDFKAFVDAKAKENPNLDFGYCNNSILVNYFPAENVIVHSHQGNTKRLSEHPKWNLWKDELNSGEFWSVVGESWIDET
jgi:hypothetical protein